MYNRFSKLFRVGLTALTPPGNDLRRSIIIRLRWVIHGNVRGPAFRVPRRIPALQHQFAYQFIRLNHDAQASLNRAASEGVNGVMSN